jgi:thioredoxin-like negative regulator of GroEL
MILRRFTSVLFLLLTTSFLLNLGIAPKASHGEDTAAGAAPASGSTTAGAAAPRKAAAEITYQEAYRQTQQSGRPLLVLVGADWCPGCRTMKNATLPALQTAGRLEDVIVTQVNCDRESELADRLMRGGSIPQLILFTQTKDGWRRHQLTGAQSPASVRTFLDQKFAETN